MNIHFICYWGGMSLLNGVFDILKLVDAVALVPFPLFSQKLPWAYNVASLIRVMGPISELIGVPLAWFSYKDYRSTKLRLELEDKWAGTVSMSLRSGSLPPSAAKGSAWALLGIG